MPRNYSKEYITEKKRVAKNYMFKATEEEQIKLDKILSDKNINFADFVREAIKKEATF